MIDQVYYINLDKRTDRREHMEKNVLSKLTFDPKIIKRITACDMTHATSTSKRQAGCCISHICAWSDAIMNNYNCVMILEDDFEFTCDPAVLDTQMKELFEKYPNFGVCNFSYNDQAPLYQIQGMDSIFYCPSVQTTSGYIIKKDFMYALLPIIGSAVNNLMNDGPPEKYAVDQAWKVLQSNMRWVVMKKVGKQRSDHSDIENCQVEYPC